MNVTWVCKHHAYLRVAKAVYEFFSIFISVEMRNPLFPRHILIRLTLQNRKAWRSLKYLYFSLLQ